LSSFKLSSFGFILGLMYLAIDIGGTKTLLAVFDEHGSLKTTLKIETPKDYKQFIEAVAQAVKQNLAAYTFKYGCCAVPGLIDRKTGMALALGNLPWQDVPIREDIARATGCHFIIENDARLGGLAEAQELIGTYRDVLYLTISTGIGGAFMRHGKLVPELLDMEVGKIPVQFEGKLSQWEDFAGGRGIVKRFGKKAMDITKPADWVIIGQNIGYGLAIACSVLQPDAIVFGGGVGQYADHFKKSVIGYLDKEMHQIVKRPDKLLTTKHKENSVIYGCYIHIKHHLEPA
jgi:predicted NBD/HSP70 family sugar kinase